MSTRPAGTSRPCAAATDHDLAGPWDALPASVREVALHGAGDRVLDVQWTFKRGARSGEHRFQGTWDGFLALVENEAHKRAAQKGAAQWREPLVNEECATCQGTGLRPEIAASAIGGLSYAEAQGMAVSELRRAVEQRGRDHAALQALLPELRERLGDLEDMGLGALPMDRIAATLSRGELQRVRLASVLRSGLAGTAVVLDEPGAGLDDDAVRNLGTKLVDLARGGNTVLVVTHRAALVSAADNVIACGPGSGSAGGEIVPFDRDGEGAPSASVAGLTAVTGPSGSGKSRHLARLEAEAGAEGRPVARIIGAVHATTPIHAFGAMPALQALYAKASGGDALPKAAFSYLSPKGRCPACGGSGTESVAMDFMADLALACEACAGARYRPEVLAVTSDGKNVAEFLATPSSDLPTGEPRLASMVRWMSSVGLGHLAPGRSVATLSGGERQRLAFAIAAAGAAPGTLFLLDEPDAGLADSDLAVLIETFRSLCAEGHSIVCATHRAPLIRAAESITLLPLQSDSGTVSP